ncbi:neuronal acetylcholine receptor subunit alpha-7-like [Vanacampus margaritifer]
MAPHYVLLVLLVSACTVQVSIQGPNELRLLQDLLRGYTALERPVVNENLTLNVDVGIFLSQIMDVDEKNQVLTTNIWLHLSWNDYKLQWDSSDYNGLDTLRLPNDGLWKPDILLYNSADKTFDSTFHTKIVVKSSGNCLYVPPGIFKSTCYMDLRWFPFDIQKCDLKFGSWTFDGATLDLTMIEADISEYIPNGEWELVVVSGKKNERSYVCCPDQSYPDVTYTIVMRRRTLFYLLHLIIPCILISILALLVFLLPADSGEKISLGITVLLSLVVFLLLVAELIPATSDSVPLIAQYFVITLAIVALSVMVTVVVLKVHHHDPNGARMPKWIRVLLFDWCAWFLFMKRPGENKTQNSLTSMDLKARMESVHPASTDSGAVGRAGEGEVLLTKGLSSTVDSEPELVKIRDEVRYIAKRFRDQQHGEATRSDWKFAAAVIDRFCFVIFLLFIIVSTFVILMSAPNISEAISKDVVS